MPYLTQIKRWAKLTAVGWLNQISWQLMGSSRCREAQPRSVQANKRKPVGKTLWMWRIWCTIIKHWRVVSKSSRRWTRTSRRTSSIANQTQIKSSLVVCRPLPQALQPSTDQNSEESPIKCLRATGWWILASAHHKLKQSSEKEHKLANKLSGRDLR